METIQGLRELTSSFEVERTERGITATKVYVYQPGDDHSADLPNVGDLFEYPINWIGGTVSATGLFCRSRKETIVNSDLNTVQFTCTYTNEPCDKTQFIPLSEDPQPSDFKNLPMTMEYSSEFVNVKPTDINSSLWKWKDNNTKVIDPIPFRVTNLTLRVKRWVPDEFYQIFMDNCLLMEGSVNLNPLPTPAIGGSGSWLFNSVNTEMYRNFDDNKMWQAELIFTYRDPDQTQVNGWNKILRRDGSWQIPVRTDTGDYMYQTNDFTYLFGNKPFEE